MEGKSIFNVGLTVIIVGAMLLAIPVSPNMATQDIDSDASTSISMASTIYVGEYEFDFRIGEPAIPSSLQYMQPQAGEPGVYLVHFNGPIQQEWVEALQKTGVDIITYVPNFAYQVRMNPMLAESISNMPFVDWIGNYHPAYKISSALNGNRVSVSFSGDTIPSSALEQVRSEMTVIEESETGSGYTMRGELSSSYSLDVIAANPYVQQISPIYTKELHDEAGMQIVGGGLWVGDNDATHATPYRVSGSFGSKFNQVTGATGAGITIGVADTGLGNGNIGNAGHLDFEDRVIGGYSYDGADFADGHGHGTHCAGLAAANGYAGTGTTYAGFGPYYVGMGLGYDANLYSVKIFSDAGAFIGPTDDGDILVRSYSGGARVSSNSWGAATGGDYIDSDSNYDMRVRDASTAAGNQQISVLVSAGNSGSAANTIGSPGNAKNVITVGGVDNYMPDGTSYGNGDTNTANPDTIYASSSRGWTDDGRIKPDIVTPGRNTLSTHSPSAGNNLFGYYSADNRYEWCTGTSQSCPTAAGGAAAVNEWYINTFGATPTPAMTKAMLINTAKDIGAADIPNGNEGWGRMDLTRISDNPTYFLPVDNPSEFTATGQYHEYSVSYIDNTKPLKFTLVWTDRYALDGAAVALINDLRLQVFAPLGQEYRGNAFTAGYTTSGTNPSVTFDTNSDGNDDRNNVECVYVSTTGLQTGLYTIRVSGFSIVGDCDNDGTNDQDYALLIYNGIDVTSAGTVDIENLRYPREATVQVEVKDADLNTNTLVQTTTINLKSNAEPAGESVLLTETGGDTGIFRGTKTISATNSVGVLWVNAADVITATYNDADDGSGSPAVVTDTAIVDGQILPVSGLTVDWFGTATKTWINEPFSSGVPPTGWQVSSSGTTGTWSQVATTNAGGTSPEARFMYGTSGTGTSRLYCGPFDTTGRTQLDLQFRTMYDAYATGVTVKVQTSTDAVTWADTGWSLVDRTTNLAASLITEAISTTEGAGSSSLYVAWVVDRNSYQLDYWYIDSVLMTSTGGSVTADNWLNWTKSGDDGAGANDVTHYNIYRSSSSSGPWDATTIVNTVPAGTATWTDVDKGEPDGINWYYVVRAVDSAGNIDTNTNAVPEQAVGGATATATGPTGGPTNVAAISILYSYTGTPTSVNIYYTTTGGTTWTLAGNDASVNGNYAWTVPASGTYGWLASAVGGGSTEPSPPSGGTAPESSSYIFDNVAPSITANTFADGATGVATATGNYDADFSENMAAVGSVTTNLPGATYSWVDANTYRISYTALAYSTTYTTTYQTTFTDVAGNALGGDRVKTFTTGAAPASTATATGPTGGPTTVTAITIAYTWTNSPTSVNLYYTINAGTSWTLAGNDASVDGSYAWTVPASGTYGWLASAVGGGSTEPSPPSGGTSPEAASYIVDITPPAAPTGLTVEHWGPGGSGGTSVETRFMRGVTNEATVNGLTSYSLSTTQSSTQQTYQIVAARQSVWAGIRVWSRSSAGTETEITSGTAVAIAGPPGNNIQGMFAATWDCPGAALATTDSIVVRIYGGTATPPAALAATFTTDTLGATQLDAVQWTVNYYMGQLSGNSFVAWGDATYNTNIANFAYTGTGTGNPTDHNTLNWTHSGADVDHYNIYRSDVQAGTYTLIASSPAGTNTYVDIDMGQADSTYWWYRVRAVDALGNEELNTISVQEPAFSLPYNIALTGKSANSWVFVSFPSGLTGNIQDILNDATAGDGGTTWTVAKWYNPQTPNDHWKTYRVGGTANDMPTINNGMGFWLYITANGGDQQLTLSSYAALPAVAVNINLYVGWNMVGYPSATNRLASATLPAQADMVSVWQAATPYIVDSTNLGAVTMAHGNAYWVHVTADTIWTVIP